MCTVCKESNFSQSEKYTDNMKWRGDKNFNMSSRA